ncbi:MAG: CocE/NonD family hydrolase [Bryobacterales bacterium]|nr:CocE/NonD family hydrolase [Bryobacterales bacterium]
MAPGTRHFRFLVGALLGWAALAAAPPVEHVRMAMRDGVTLSANLFRPSETGRFPVILVRTPYGKGKDLPRNYRLFPENGYAVVIQDVRGRYESEGEFDPLHQELQDGEDTLNWAGQAAWSNGKVGMVGGSYLGIVQWKAALSGNRYLKCIFPVVSGYDDYRDRLYSTGGAMKLGNRLLWMASNMRVTGYTPPEFSLFVRALPVQAADLAATGQRVKMFQEAIEHPTFDGYWKSISTREQIAKVKTPVFSVGGWYDNFVQSDLEAFSALRGMGRQAHTLIGPWAHNMSLPFEGFAFGPESSAPVQRYQLEWFDRWLKGKIPARHPAPARIFVMGVNQWRDETEWPPSRAVPTRLYLTSEDGANSVAGDGGLGWQMPRKAHEDRFVYDPANPVPTMGGSTCCNPAVFRWGPMDQSAVETRQDVLVYTSEPLPEDLEVTGTVLAFLHVATSARDTDFTVKLVDVYPDGRAVNLTDGIVRMRYREGLERTVPVEPGRAYAVTVDAGVTSNVFLAGHKIRVEISSSNFPRFDRNLNTGGRNAMERKGVVAHQIVYTGANQASHVLLPVVKAK